MNKRVLTRLQRVEGFVFDMDGTLALGNRRNETLKPLPGAVRFLKKLDKLDLPFVVFTNGTVRMPEQYIPLLRKIGFPMRKINMMTPSTVAADIFSRRNYRRVMPLGGRGVWKPVEQLGMEIVMPSKNVPDDIDAVYVGWHREFTMDDLDAACHAIWRGARLYSASLVPFFATAGGRAIGTSHAICAGITAVTGKRAITTGKPALSAMRYAARRLGVDAKNIAVVGDDPALEIAMAHKGGALAIAVNSGLGNAEIFSQMGKEDRPHMVVDGMAELLKLYRPT